MWQWVSAHFGLLITVFIVVAVAVEILFRWIDQYSSADRYLSRRWVRELHER